MKAAQKGVQQGINGNDSRAGEGGAIGQERQIWQ